MLLILFLSFCLRVIRKGLRKNSEIFVNLRRSSGQSMGCSGVLWDVPGVFRGCSGLFQAVPVVFRGCSGVFRGCSGVFRGVPGFTDTQFRLHRAILQITRLLVHLFLCRTATTTMPFCIHSMKLTYNQLPHLVPRVISHLNIVQISKLRLDFTNFYCFGFVTRMDNEITARFFNFHHCFI